MPKWIDDIFFKNYDISDKQKIVIGITFFTCTVSMLLIFIIDISKMLWVTPVLIIHLVAYRFF